MSMDDRDGVIWLDGELVPWREATVHVLTHTLHYGMGVFEGIRAYQTAQGTAIFRLHDHMRRLYESAHVLRMQIQFDKKQLSAACCEVVAENQLDSAYIRPMCFYGAEGMGLRADNLKVHSMVAAWEWGAYLGTEAMEKGIRVKTVSFTRHHVNITLCRAKANGNYLNSMLALQEALDCGYDEALLLDNSGYVAEGSGENIFIVRDGTLYTPYLTSALDGITRQTVIALAKQMQIPVVERLLTRDDIYIAAEAFFSGTAAEVTPIRELDGRMIGDGKRGPVTMALQTAYFDAVHGRSSAEVDWLTAVPMTGKPTSLRAEAGR